MGSFKSIKTYNSSKLIFPREGLVNFSSLVKKNHLKNYLYEKKIFS